MSNNDNSQYVQVLLQTLHKQKEALLKVLDITKKQSEIAVQDDFDEDAFADTLNQKEIMISKLNSLDDGFASVYERVRGEVLKNQGNYTNEIREMQKLIKQCTDLSMEIKVLEERNYDRIVQGFSGLQKQYGAKLNAATVASKYYKTMKANSGGQTNITF